jgi:hypothetical protein
MKEKNVNISKWALFAQTINQQTSHFTAPGSVIDFHAL